MKENEQHTLKVRKKEEEMKLGNRKKCSKYGYLKKKRVDVMRRAYRSEKMDGKRWTKFKSGNKYVQ